MFTGGGGGALLRHGVNLLSAQLGGPGFPWGTLAINVAGSALMGVVAGALTTPGTPWRLFLATGVLGGFTTFSAFSLEAATLVERGQTGAALAYAGVSVGLAVAALFAGLWISRALA